MKIFLLFIPILLLLSGCGIYDRQTIQFTCDNNNNIVVKVYKAKLVSDNEDIVQDKFLVRESILTNKDFEVTCKRINKWKILP